MKTVLRNIGAFIMAFAEAMHEYRNRKGYHGGYY